MATWLARGDLDDDIPQFVQNWEQNFYRDPDNFGLWMETALNATIASNVIAVPSDYLDLKYAYVNTSRSSRLVRVSLNQLYGTYPRGAGTGVPVWMSREVNSFVFGPEPDSTYNIRGVYWAKPLALRDAESSAVNTWLMQNASDLVLYGSLLEATPFLRNDKRIPMWTSMYERALGSYRRLQNCEPRSGTPLQEVLA